MKLRFHRDPETGLPHIFDHGVTEDEVREVLARPVINFRSDRNSRSIIGQTLAGRCLKVVIVPIRRDRIRVDRKGFASVSPCETEKKSMKNTPLKKDRLPKGWTDEQIRKLADHHDNLTEDEQAAEIDAAMNASDQTVMVVPTELVPEIIKLIDKKRPA
jgi:hypothetical protein